MTELPVTNPDWTSFCQLVQQLAAGNVRRYTFTKWEIDLLLDLQMARMRRSSRPDALRRYLKAIHRQMASGGASAPLRFARFWENETQPRISPAEPVAALPRAS
ncbi:MAG TPA: hypothetical protein VHZ55_25355 [Bryobacteraceae bacterium]|nr:hypothetical protein [Bryobacteraceae bacterium]